MSVNLDGMKTDTDNILTDWAETLTIRRNTPTYGDDLTSTNVWATTATETGDIQHIKGGKTIMTAEGQEITVVAQVFFAFDTAALEGDRIQPAGWSTGDNEYKVEYVRKLEDHAVAYCNLVKGHTA